MLTTIPAPVGINNERKIRRTLHFYCMECSDRPSVELCSDGEYSCSEASQTVSCGCSGRGYFRRPLAVDMLEAPPATLFSIQPRDALIFITINVSKLTPRFNAL